MILEKRFEFLTPEQKEGVYQQLALTREEIPVISGKKWPDRHPLFIVPIHPLILSLSEEIRFDQQYAEEVFDQVWDLALEDVEQFVSDLDNNVGEKEREYLERMVGKGKEHWRFEHFGRSQDLLLSVQCRGFDTFAFPSNRDSLPGILVPSQVKFPRGKINDYIIEVEDIYEGRDSIMFRSSAFITHNVDNMVQAFLLRNWCIVYHNQLLRIAIGLETPK